MTRQPASVGMYPRDGEERTVKARLLALVASLGLAIGLTLSLATPAQAYTCYTYYKCHSVSNTGITGNIYVIGARDGFYTYGKYDLVLRPGGRSYPAIVDTSGIYVGVGQCVERYYKDPNGWIVWLSTIHGGATGVTWWQSNVSSGDVYAYRCGT